MVIKKGSTASCVETNCRAVGRKSGMKMPRPATITWLLVSISNGNGEYYSGAMKKLNNNKGPYGMLQKIPPDVTRGDIYCYQFPTTLMRASRRYSDCQSWVQCKTMKEELVWWRCSFRITGGRKKSIGGCVSDSTGNLVNPCELGNFEFQRLQLENHGEDVPC